MLMNILVQSLHWYNPFLWLAMRRLRAARELACDAAVLTRLPADQRTSYGSTLIKILDSCSKMSAAPSLLPILNRKEQLHRRIRMIAHYKPSTRLAAFASALLLLALGCLTFTRAANKPALAPPAPTQSSAAESDADSALRKISPALASRPDDTAERLAYYQLRLDLLKERHMQAADL